MNKEASLEAAPRRCQPPDREAASALLGDIRPLDAPGCHTFVFGAASPTGAAVWIEPPGASDEAYLGPVLTLDGPPSRPFYGLVLACADDALALGFKRAYFTIKDSSLLRLLQRTFRIDPVATGWEPLSGAPSEWEVHVDLPDAIQQLRQVIDQLDGRID